nr:immunoglobulin light chain junction region [Macaca mulatta]MOV75750.1 immunoglobulin light chain junction region [Macaca mulatta]MOV92583.1 immunoglobulin light chain junction region [Macaca mulatta]MOV93890.1 immunoglobulin light chain junction region [Macaca mulatta]MOW14786.1 immunoglobulin light chain junction region [Macaca mulatta]
CQQYNNLPYSF